MQDGELDADNVAFPGDPFEGEEFARVYDADGQLVFDNTSELHRPALDTGGLARRSAAAHRGATTTANGADLRVLTAPICCDGEVVGALEVGLHRARRQAKRSTTAR